MRETDDQNNNQQQPNVVEPIDLNSKQKKGEVFGDDLPDHTSSFTQEEIKSGKTMSLLSYLSIVALVPYLTEKKNRYVMFHAKQGMNLFIYEAIFFMIDSILGAILPGIAFIAYLAVIALFVFSLVGIIFVLNSEARDLPFIDKIKIIR